eukprot:scaffold1911_cov397-Prasinococcus_capsulatus_cf.AAC.5
MSPYDDSVIMTASFPRRPHRAPIAVTWLPQSKGAGAPHGHRPDETGRQLKSSALSRASPTAPLAPSPAGGEWARGSMAPQPPADAGGQRGLGGPAPGSAGAGAVRNERSSAAYGNLFQRPDGAQGGIADRH